MNPVLRSTAALAAMTLVCAPSSAAPWVGADELQRNGAVSQHFWAPDLMRQDLAGLRLSAGLALGLRGVVQSQLGRSAAPALTLGVGADAQASLLPAGRRGVMLVLHTTR